MRWTARWTTVNVRDSEARALLARRRAHGVTRLPLGNGMASRYTRSGCLVAERPGVAGVQPGLPVARIGARDTRYRPAIARPPAARLLPLPLCPHSPADAHHPPGATSASDDHRGSRGASHTTAIAPHGARVLRGKPLRCCCSVLRALRVLRHGHAGFPTMVHKGTASSFE